MTRGRAPNLALPLTKALAQQRDYRARKAANIARLESENELLRSENAKLRQDIASYQQGKPVPEHERSTKDASETSIPENQYSQTSAGYAELKRSYEQLEAEVQRKEQVLLSLRDKEKEAFARVEALLQQSYQVVGNAMISQDPQSPNHDLSRTIVKEEPLKNVSSVYALPPVNGQHFANEQTNGSMIHNTSIPASRYYTQLSANTPTLRATVTTVSNRTSFSPDPESYRARKRVRSASDLAASVGPQHIGSSRPYPGHTSEMYEQHSASPYLSPEYSAQSAMYPAARPVLDDRTHGSTSRTHVPPLVSPFPIHDGGLSRRDSSEQTHPYSYTGERIAQPYLAPIHQPPVSLDYARHLEPLRPLMTPPMTSFARDFSSDSRPSSIIPFSGHESTVSARDSANGVGQRGWISEVRQSQPLNLSYPHALDPPRPPDRVSYGNAQTSTTHLDRTAKSRTGSFNTPLSLVTRPCSPCKPCGPKGECNPSDERSSKSCRSSPRLPSVTVRGSISSANPDTHDNRDRGNVKEESVLPPPPSNCCNGLFDCSSLPVNLWMPLHQMSTSYERGSTAVKTLTATTVLPSADLVSGPAEAGSSEEGKLLLPTPRLDTRSMKGSEERGSPVSEAGPDEECCFGILRCEDGAVEETA